jgi:hypothetical protein
MFAYVNNWAKFPNKRVIIRVPLPYKVGGSRYPSNASEKLRCEAASFIWIQDNCPTVPIPYLWGFGFSDSQSVCIGVPLLKSREYTNSFEHNIVQKAVVHKSVVHKLSSTNLQVTATVSKRRSWDILFKRGRHIDFELKIYILVI